MGRGDHIYINCGVYTHHGIDCGDDTVIHHPGGLGHKMNAVISCTTMASFASGKQVFVREYESPLSTDIVILRAESRLNKAGYDLFYNNCEHFATWCKTGNKKSEQVDNPIGVAGDNALIAVENTIDLGLLVGELMKAVPVLAESAVRYDAYRSWGWFLD